LIKNPTSVQFSGGNGGGGGGEGNEAENYGIEDGEQQLFRQRIRMCATVYKE
jgi:hypothetical protein